MQNYIYRSRLKEKQEEEETVNDRGMYRTWEGTGRYQKSQLNIKNAQFGK
jgi:hypothetical protein